MSSRRVLVLVGVAAVSLALVGCGALRSAGPTVTEDRDVADDVTAVVLKGSGHLSLHPGTSPTLSVTAGRDLMDRISTDSRDGVLHLDLDGRFFGRGGDVSYDVELAEVNGIRIEGSGDVDATVDPTGSLTVEIDGSGDIRVDGIEVEDLSVVVSGSGYVELTGTADTLDVLIEGSGEFSGGELVAADAVATIEGSGDIEVHATDTLQASISGSGSIEHTGGAVVSQEISGSGSVSGS